MVKNRIVIAFDKRFKIKPKMTMWKTVGGYRTLYVHLPFITMWINF